MSKRYIKARSSRRGRSEGDERVSPTDETKARLRPDETMVLFERGILEQLHVDAAGEIRVVWEALSRALSPKAMSLYNTGNISKATDPIGMMSGREAELYDNTFKPWMNKTSKILCFPNYWISNITIDVAVSNVSCRAIDEALFRDNPGKAAKHYREGLAMYARSAGWTRNLD